MSRSTCNTPCSTTLKRTGKTFGKPTPSGSLSAKPIRIPLPQKSKLLSPPARVPVPVSIYCNEVPTLVGQQIAFFVVNNWKK